MTLSNEMNWPLWLGVIGAVIAVLGLVAIAIARTRRAQRIARRQAGLAAERARLEASPAPDDKPDDKIVDETVVLDDSADSAQSDFTPELVITGPNSAEFTQDAVEPSTDVVSFASAPEAMRQGGTTALALSGASPDTITLDLDEALLEKTEGLEGRLTLPEAPVVDTAVDAEAGEPSTATEETIDASPSADETPQDGDAEPTPTSTEDEVRHDLEIPHPEVLAATAGLMADLEAARCREAALRTDLETARAALQAGRAGSARAVEAARAEAVARIDLAEETTRRLESLGRVTGGMATDFNALLAVMTSALDMLMKSADDPERVRRLGAAALTAGQRGEALTRRLSALSQEHGERAQVLDAGVLLRAMESRLRALVGPGIDLMIEGPYTDAPVRVDPVGFESAVQHLVRNAVEAQEGAGSVAVRLEAAPDKLWRLIVRDTGPGLDATTAARAIEPFFTTREGSSGLGLTQVHAFARQSGGSLTLTGAEGEGAEATLILPAATVEDAART